jgi:hypothetical protein
MGFWRRLFGLETEEEREARRLKVVVSHQRKEAELRAYYTNMVRDTVERGDEFGYAVECMTAYETVVIAAVKRYTRHNYIVTRDNNEELEWIGKTRFVINYIIPPSPNHPNPSTSLWHQIQLAQQSQNQIPKRENHEDPF